MTERDIPHSIEAEGAVLGSILLDPEYVLKRSSFRELTPDDFYEKGHLIGAQNLPSYKAAEF